MHPSIILCPIGGANCPRSRSTVSFEDVIALAKFPSYIFFRNPRLRYASVEHTQIPNGGASCRQLESILLNGVAVEERGRVDVPVVEHKDPRDIHSLSLGVWAHHPKHTIARV